jgi:hypothetical protein
MTLNFLNVIIISYDHKTIRMILYIYMLTCIRCCWPLITDWGGLRCLGRTVLTPVSLTARLWYSELKCSMINSFAISVGYQPGWTAGGIFCLGDLCFAVSRHSKQDTSHFALLPWRKRCNVFHSCLCLLSSAIRESFTAISHSNCMPAAYHMPYRPILCLAFLLLVCTSVGLIKRTIQLPQ